MCWGAKSEPPRPPRPEIILCICQRAYPTIMIKEEFGALGTTQGKGQPVPSLSAATSGDPGIAQT